MSKKSKCTLVLENKVKTKGHALKYYNFCGDKCYVCSGKFLGKKSEYKVYPECEKCKQFVLNNEEYSNYIMNDCYYLHEDIR